MSRIYKRLYGPAQLTNTAADFYTCPASTVARTLHIHASNPSGSPAALNLSIGADAAATRVWDGFVIGADDVEDVFDSYEFTGGEKIQGWATPAPTMFPTTALLDDFNRADESPLTTNWTTPFAATGASAALSDSGVITDNTPPANPTAYWDVEQFGPDCEAWITCSADLDANESFSVHARMSGVGTDTFDSYEVGLNAATGLVGLGRRDNGSYTNLDSLAVTPQTGDSIGIRCIGSTIEAWYRPVGGSWSLACSQVDATYGSAGYTALAMYTEDFTTKLDNFGGGDIATEVVLTITGHEDPV